MNNALEIKKISSENRNLDQLNRELVFKDFGQFFFNENKSLISDLFYAISNTVTECFYCHQSYYTFQAYFFLTFPLEEVRKYIFQNNNQNINSVN